ncbi:hypothetical protein KI387_033201 [Taxus chinensis]|uniref:Bifunctional inhibitor/plant lipid transfer protein/seed storage helical domain-containing protein n=1 Tax=Taxus chinensis TaxID=29808 RepID=A0AA38C327_TAXCH|nr:hypothetical protein KI387_033201 [Taxus chinensis]
MAGKSVSVILLAAVVMIAVAANYGVVVAQSPAPSSGCATSLITLSPCVGYITSNVTTSPTQGCCTALSSVVQNSAVCLCQLFSTNNPLGFPINQTRALALPGACKITTPPLSQCKGAPAPSASAGASAPASRGSTNGAPVPASSSSPAAESPSASVGGISPTASVDPTSKAGTLFAPSTIISVLAGMIVVSTMW